jgi:hypothetical protein
MFKIKRKTKQPRQHAYRVRLERMIQFGLMPRKGARILSVAHDPACHFLSGGICDCVPSFEFGPEIKAGEKPNPKTVQ